MAGRIASIPAVSPQSDTDLLKNEKSNRENISENDKTDLQEDDAKAEEAKKAADASAGGDDDDDDAEESEDWKMSSDDRWEFCDHPLVDRQRRYSAFQIVEGPSKWTSWSN